MYYILINNKPVKEPDTIKWAKWYQTTNRTVKQTQITNNIRVSTVFLGLDHRFDETIGNPLVFETMIFGGKYDQYQERYTSWEEAIRGHLIAEKIASKGYKILKAILECLTYLQAKKIRKKNNGNCRTT